jgi:hypothetical protein
VPWVCAVGVFSCQLIVYICQITSINTYLIPIIFRPIVYRLVDQRVTALFSDLNLCHIAVIGGASIVYIATNCELPITSFLGKQVIIESSMSCPFWLV